MAHPLFRTASEYLDLATRLIRGQPSGEALERYQSRQLRRLVRHAYDRVPYYRALFDRHGVKPEHIRGVRDLEKVPTTSRPDIQSLPPDQVVARGVDPRRMEIHRTGGSTGRPFDTRRTLAEDRFLFAMRLRAFHQLGWRPRDRWANVALVGRSAKFKPGPMATMLRMLGSFRPRGISCTLPLQDVIAALRDYRPDVITGYPNTLARVAQMLTDEDRRVLRPRLIVTESEVLAPLMRERIREGFRVPVHEFYASWEFNVLAWECPTSGELHTCGDTVLLEVMTDGKAVSGGERGEVVATGLHSFAMPLIRFRLGDVVTQGRAACTCGGPYATIRAVQGRMLDFFPLPDGRLLHPYEISTLAIRGDTDWVRQYQLTQVRKDRIVLRVVPIDQPAPDVIDSFRKRAGELLGPGVELDLQLVPDIPPEPNGKYRIARSLVQSMYDESATR